MGPQLSNPFFVFCENYLVRLFSVRSLAVRTYSCKYGDIRWTRQNEAIDDDPRPIDVCNPDNPLNTVRVQITINTTGNPMAKERLPIFPLYFVVRGGE